MIAMYEPKDVTAELDKYRVLAKTRGKAETQRALDEAVHEATTNCAENITDLCNNLAQLPNDIMHGAADIDTHQGQPTEYLELLCTMAALLTAALQRITADNAKAIVRQSAARVSKIAKQPLGLAPDEPTVGTHIARAAWHLGHMIRDAQPIEPILRATLTYTLAVIHAHLERTL